MWTHRCTSSGKVIREGQKRACRRQWARCGACPGDAMAEPHLHRNRLAPTENVADSTGDAAALLLPSSAQHVIDLPGDGLRKTILQKVENGLHGGARHPRRYRPAPRPYGSARPCQFLLSLTPSRTTVSILMVARDSSEGNRNRGEYGAAIAPRVVKRTPWAAISAILYIDTLLHRRGEPESMASTPVASRKGADRDDRENGKSCTQDCERCDAWVQR
jgi:hypothetical protein